MFRATLPYLVDIRIPALSKTTFVPTPTPGITIAGIAGSAFQLVSSVGPQIPEHYNCFAVVSITMR
jgi:hypothetical protein